MRAMLLEKRQSIGNSPLKSAEVPDPAPMPGEIRVRVEACAICRTDLHVVEGDLTDGPLPIIPGHQIVGSVDRLGTGVTGWRLGQRAGIAWLRHTDGTCRYCFRGDENLCVAPSFTGYHTPGGYAGYAVVPADFALSLPEGPEASALAPLLCAGIIGYRAYRRSRAQPGEVLGISGFGSSAHLITQLAVAQGCEVFVASRALVHQKLARELGAVWVGADFGAAPRKLDRAILFAPVGDLVPPILEALAPGGTLAIAGIHLSDIPALNYERHLFHEKEIRSVTANTRADAREWLEQSMRAGVRTHIREYRLDQANEALQDLKADRISGTGVLRIGC